jgi:glycosyltransferase involved in cell wall biosynthesis
MQELLFEYQPDLVHAHNLWMRLSPAPLEAPHELGVPVVMTVHDYAWVCPRKWMITADDLPCDLGFGPRCAVSRCRGSREGALWMPYNALRWAKTSWHRRMLIRWVDRFISPSLHLARWMERSLGVGGVAHIANFAPSVGSASVSGVSNPRTLGFAGRLSREKGIDVLLRALPRVVASHPDTRLLIAGDGPERRRLESLADDLCISDVVRFTGALGPEGLDWFYGELGLLVLPTLWMENCPVSVLEAFAHGRAVVATRIGGLPELVEDGRTGALFERGDESDLGSRLTELLADPEAVRAMCANAKTSWSKDFTPELHARRLRAVYDELCSVGG